MKKSIYTLVAGVLLIAATSCKKDYTCDCVYTDDLGTEQTSTSQIEDSKLDDAKAECESMSGSVSIGGFDADQECKLDVI